MANLSSKSAACALCISPPLIGKTRLETMQEREKDGFRSLCCSTERSDGEADASILFALVYGGSFGGRSGKNVGREPVDVPQNSEENAID